MPSLSASVDKPICVPSEIPTDWVWQELVKCCRPRQWPTISKEQLLDEGFPVYGANGLIGYYSEYNHENPTIAVTCRGATCGTLNYVPAQSYITGNAMCLDDLDLEKISENYLYYALLHRGLFDVITGSAQPQITAQSLKKVTFPCPALPEQKKIAEILESVDDAIAKTEGVIAQTQRVKQGLLQQLLTRGIGHTKFKQTELGEIPESWDLMLGEKIFKLGGGHGPADINFEDDGDILFLKVDDFNTPENAIGLKTSKLKFKKLSQAKRLNIYPKGTLVFPKRGAAIFKNRVQILLEDATVDPNLMCLDAFGIDAQYLREYMLFIGLHNFSDNSGVPQINNKHLYPLFFPVPPRAEQKSIIGTLSSIDLSIQSSIDTLSSLRAKKSALMSDLLTGRVRVNIDAKSSNKIEEAA